MAQLDDLLAQIADGDLRERIAGEVQRLRRGVRFGLVFERHIPEVVRLYGHPLRVGQLVQLRVPDDGRLWLLAELDDGKAVLRAVEDDAETAVDSDEVVTVRRFGEPLYPGVTEVGAIDRGGPERPAHVVINGENFDALQLLVYLHEGQVDAIYIDPPYNTGARDWKYNNDYVDANDAYRHSKWLSMMERRLRVTQRLLKPDGVLVVTVDEHEMTRLGVLLQQLFPAAAVQLVSICINPSGASSDGLSRVDEYAFFCWFGGARPSALTRDLLTDQDLESAPASVAWESLLRRGNQWYRRSRRNLCYPVLLNEDEDTIVGVGDPFVGEDEESRPDRVDGHKAAWPVRTDGRLGIWRVDGAKLLELAAKGYAYVASRDEDRGTWTVRYLMQGTVDGIEAGNYVVTGRGARNEVLVETDVVRTTVPKTMWKSSRHIAGGAGGTQLLTTLLGERNLFTYPKSVYAVQDTLTIAVGDRPDALVLDFFAGSGTTLHATALLNAADGGRRRCILVTNNEVEQSTEDQLLTAGHRPGDDAWSARGVFRQATKPRVEAAITGRRPNGDPLPDAARYLGGRCMADGFDENVRFYDLAYLDRDAVDLGEAFAAVAPLLWMKAGAVGPIIIGNEGAWEAPEGAPYAVLFRPTHWRHFVNHVQSRHDLTHVFVVTDSTATFVQIREELPPWTEASMLYRDYLYNFEINVDRGA